MLKSLTVEPLTRAGFAPFGEVIETPPVGGEVTNGGLAVRHDEVAKLDLVDGGSRPLLGIFRVKPTPLPIEVRWLECHPKASQAFVPLGERAFLVIVAPAGPAPDPAAARAFLTNGRQGVNYRRGTWHFPVIALERDTDFLVIDRGDADGNYAEAGLAGSMTLTVRL
jgi:ureidoglycolate lyase